MELSNLHLLVCFGLQGPDWIEKWMLHSFGRCDPTVFVVYEHLVKEVKAVLGHSRVVILVYIVL